MISLPGYQIVEKIYESNQSAVFRGYEKSPSKSPVIIKYLGKEYPTINQLASFKREFEITQRLQGEGIVKAFALEKVNDSLAIVLEDFEGESIDRCRC